MQVRKTCYLCFFVAFGSCATKKVKSLGELELRDVFHHSIMDAFGVPKQKAPKLKRDPELEVMLHSFVADAARHGVIIHEDTVDRLRRLVYVEQLSYGKGKGVVAACSRFYITKATLSGPRQLKWMQIEVLRSGAEELTGGEPQLLKELVYHELYHCLLNKGHLPPDVEGIMSAKLIAKNTRAIKHWDDLIADMFSPYLMSLTPDMP